MTTAYYNGENNNIKLSHMTRAFGLAVTQRHRCSREKLLST